MRTSTGVCASHTLGNLKRSVEYVIGRVPPQSLVAVMEALCQGRWWVFPLVVLPPPETVRMSVRSCNSQADPRWDQIRLYLQEWSQVLVHHVVPQGMKSVLRSSITSPSILSIPPPFPSLREPVRYARCPVRYPRAPDWFHCFRCERPSVYLASKPLLNSHFLSDSYESRSPWPNSRPLTSLWTNPDLPPLRFWPKLQWQTRLWFRGSKMNWLSWRPTRSAQSASSRVNFLPPRPPTKNFLQRLESLPLLRLAKVTFAASRLRGDALKWWRQLKTGGAAEGIDYEAFKKQLCERFLTINPVGDARDQLAELKQTKSAESYSSILRSVALNVIDLFGAESLDRYIRRFIPKLCPDFCTSD